jgi:hypothetical protein
MTHETRAHAGGTTRSTRMIWDSWKKGFDSWEDTTARYTEQMLKSPLILRPVGSLLGRTMKAKATYDRAIARWIGSFGVATKRDQERTLHTLNQIESRLLDLEERLSDAANRKKD